jgi:hypothetical protein
MEPTVTTGLGPEGSRMPFTPSHAAAVLPLVRTPLPASALVVGSVAPDLPYYLPWTAGLVTHTALAVVSTDLVLGALIWVVWHAVLAAPAVAVAPSWLRARLAGVPLGLRGRVSSPSAVGRVALALVAGSATHVLWDEFTHARRWGAEHVPVLAAVYGPLPGWAWAQQASGVLGAVVLLAWFVRWWRRAPVHGDRRPVAWWPWVVVVGAGAVVGGAAALAAPRPGSAAFQGATWGGFGAGVSGLALAVGWHLGRRRAG